MTFDPKMLGATFRCLAHAVLSALPGLEQHASMMEGQEADGLSLVLKVPSPSGDTGRSLVIWVDEVCTPSIAFGPTHTHEAADEEGIAAVVDRAKAILADEMLMIVDIEGGYAGAAGFMDLRDPDALLEELTSRYSPGKAFLKSWSGQSDRFVTTENMSG